MSDHGIGPLLIVYNHALNRVFVMACVFCAIAWFATCFLEFTKTAKTPEETTPQRSAAEKDEMAAAP